VAKVFCFFSSEKKTFPYRLINEALAHLSAYGAEPPAFPE
jgi:hypothetical protein